MTKHISHAVNEQYTFATITEVRRSRRSECLVSPTDRYSTSVLQRSFFFLYNFLLYNLIVAFKAFLTSLHVT